ncbi:carboxylating nicotinate-nucleotide diphosphorylase [Haloferula rosea]|uniref:Probable nicotinate-nucleotide pyrophosphorylase [carboxylating] n=1 Tax=Haloferula rosea TaxID=490093 RepID=A0A934RA91_9BACT|nr:carboxylating nicotinate-nucleotide diphosphorylase [Haloferula rosea]MBK1825927.1 carboxylating nicotinate-nucleotide diphosphorylase [Haloferula rosea]
MDAAASALIDAALAEDIGPGDVTSEYFVPEDRQVRALLVAREEGCLAGVEVAAEVFRRVDPAIDVQVLLTDGSRVSAGAHVLIADGPARGILTAERTALNFLQRLSGVATATRRYVDAVAETSARILDTRKTTPGWRLLEKAAVLAGGGTNHRMGLYDRAMVKDNHLVAEHDPASLQDAIRRLKETHPEVEVELEADELEQVEAFLALEGVDHILLDNMSLEELRKAVALRGDHPRPLLEASGGVTLETVQGIAETGVDFVSVGAITHSVMALDLALDFVELEVS